MVDQLRPLVCLGAPKPLMLGLGHLDRWSQKSLDSGFEGAYMEVFLKNTRVTTVEKEHQDVQVSNLSLKPAGTCGYQKTSWEWEN